MVLTRVLCSPHPIKRPKLQQKIRQPHQGHPPTKFFSTSLTTPELSTPPQLKPKYPPIEVVSTGNRTFDHLNIKKPNFQALFNKN